MSDFSRTRVAFTATFTSIVGLFVWACSSSGTTSGGTVDDAATSVDSGKTNADGSTPGACASPKTVCSGDCVDTATNDEHCGACGKKCGAGEMCAQGKCVTDCPTGSTKCSVGGKDICVSTATDNQNCGACGKKCDSGYVCSAGKCELTCTAGYSTCTGVKPASDAGADASGDASVVADAGSVAPYCAKLSEDRSNCGTCGNVCGLSKVCTGGLCCNGNELACGGVCSNVAEDPNNCGSCGKVCPVATPYCSNSVCVDRYVFAGVRTDIAAATATNGWTECFKEQFNQSTPLANIKAACSKSKIMMACRQVGQPNLQVLAQAPRADVFFDTGDGSGARHDANNVSWYWSDNASFGFLPVGATIDRDSCDWVDSYPGSAEVGVGQGDKRMCTHTNGASSDDGWRCGRDNGIGGGWERILYHAD